MTKEEKTLKEQYFEFIEKYAKVQNPQERGHTDIPELADDLKTMKKTIEDKIAASKWRGIDEARKHLGLVTATGPILAVRVLKPLIELIAELRKQVNNREIIQIQEFIENTMGLLVRLKIETTSLIVEMEKVDDETQKVMIRQFTEQQDFETIGEIVKQVPAKITEILGVVAQTISHH